MVTSTEGMDRDHWRGARSSHNIPFKLMTSLMMATRACRRVRGGRETDEALTDAYAGSTTRSQECGGGDSGVVVGRGLIFCGLELRRSVAPARRCTGHKHQILASRQEPPIQLHSIPSATRFLKTPRIPFSWCLFLAFLYSHWNRWLEKMFI